MPDDAYYWLTRTSANHMRCLVGKLFASMAIHHPLGFHETTQSLFIDLFKCNFVCVYGVWYIAMRRPESISKQSPKIGPQTVHRRVRMRLRTVTGQLLKLVLYNHIHNN